MAQSFPAELPERIDSPAAWTATGLRAEDGGSPWLVHLMPEEVQELEVAAMRWLHEVASDPSLVARADGPGAFPLAGSLGQRLVAVREELLTGRGFLVLRGLPVERWGRRLVAVAFFGLGLHLGVPRPQNKNGHLLGHVRDTGKSSTDPSVRIYQTRERQTFHTDSADLVGLLCLQTAKRGGDSQVVSSVAVYNEMRRQRPDLAALLFEPIATDHRGEHPPGCPPFFNIPVFNWHDGALTAIYQRQYIDSAQRYEEAPVLTPQHVEALDLFDALANDSDLALTMRLEVGDLQLLHTHTTLHDRSAFEDWTNVAQRRHLLRLWLAPPVDVRRLPPIFAERYGTVEPGLRGGVSATGTAMLPIEELAAFDAAPASAL